MPMRDLPLVYSEAEAEAMLRDGEILWPGGWIDQCGVRLFCFGATKDEDFMPKDYRLKHRREQRKKKRTKHDFRDGPSGRV